VEKWAGAVEKWAGRGVRIFKGHFLPRSTQATILKLRRKKRPRRLFWRRCWWAHCAGVLSNLADILGDWTLSF
jgi:hypothetical protein